MKKSILKWTLALIVIIPFLLLSSFRLNEHLKGSSFISYLESNIESVSLEEAFSFQIMQKDIEDHNIILVGEIHGFHEPIAFDPAFFRHLNQQHGVTDYFVELDYSQAYYLNKYNQTGDDALLKKVLKNWVVGIGRENLDYFNRWKTLGEFYRSGARFTYLGNDIIADVELLAGHLTELTNEAFHYNAIQSDSIQIRQYQEQLSTILKSNQFSEEDLWELLHISRNMKYAVTNKHREETLTANFIDLYKNFGLSSKKVYGYYGLGHTVLAPFESGYKSMATRLSDAVPSIQGEILSINFVFTDSYMTTRSEHLPDVLRDEGTYTRLPTSYDNIWLSYLYGIEDLKRITSPNTKTIIKINGNNSPYRESQRLVEMVKVLPIGQVVNASNANVSTDYYQYLIYVRNSDWAQP